MKKDTIYSIRINRHVREALKRASQKEHRTVASLLDKIIIDYLEKEGFSFSYDLSQERRKFPRKKITLPVMTYFEVGDQKSSFPSVILDLSARGALLTYPKGSDIHFNAVGTLPQFELCFDLPNTGESVCLSCSARRLAEVGQEIHVGATFDDSSRQSIERLKGYLA